MRFYCYYVTGWHWSCVFLPYFILGKDCRFPLPLRRCLLGFREGMELFKFGLGRLTGVLRQKGFVYDLGGTSTGTVLEVYFVQFPFS